VQVKKLVHSGKWDKKKEKRSRFSSWLLYFFCVSIGGWGGLGVTYVHIRCLAVCGCIGDASGKGDVPLILERACVGKGRCPDVSCFASCILFLSFFLNFIHTLTDPRLNRTPAAME